jgi:cyclophilin family peptidyl-prolyl cis-trans isomerase
MAPTRLALFARTLFTLLLLCGLSLRSRADLDFNLDGKTDIAFQSQSNAGLIYWNLNGPNFIGGGTLPAPVSTDWKLIDSGRMTADNVPALLYQNSTTNQVLYAFLNGATTTGGFVLAQTPVSGYKLVGVGDFNGDTKPDLVFQNEASGQIVFWFMNGTSYLGGAQLNVLPNANYKVVGVGDINGDGQPDFVLQNQVSNQIVFWFMNGTNLVGGASMAVIPSGGYSVVGLGDVTNSGRPNLILQNATSGRLVYWLLNGTDFAGGDVMTSPFSGDYKATGIRSYYPRPAAARLDTLGLANLYGVVRLRVRNLHDPTANVSVRVGNVVSPAVRLVYADTAATDTGFGGAIDFLVPTGMAAGSQNLIVTINGKDTPPFKVNVSDTNPFAVFTATNSSPMSTQQFVAELRADVAPNTVANFVGLATGTKPWLDPCNNNTVTNAPFYDGLTFHRVIAGFVAQAGDPLSRCVPESDGRIGSGSPGFTIPFEKTGLGHADGALSMARSSDLNSASSQFFICDGPQNFLDPTFDAQGNPISGYVVFGKVVENLEFVKSFTKTHLNDQAGTKIPGAVPAVITKVIISGKIDSK